MELRNEIYDIISHDENTFRIKLLSDSVIFKSHFEGMPILPGVCMIRIITELAHLHLQSNLLLSKIVNVKYLNVISPNEISELDILFSDVRNYDNNVHIRGCYQENNTIYTKFSIIYTLDNQ